jgi:hypothetical protein
VSDAEKERLRAKFGWKAGDVKVTPPPKPEPPGK